MTSTCLIVGVHDVVGHVKNEPPKGLAWLVLVYQRCCGTGINDVVNLDTLEGTSKQAELGHEPHLASQDRRCHSGQYFSLL